MIQRTTCLFLLILCSTLCYGQGLICDKSFGLLTNWQGRQSTRYIDGGDEIFRDKFTYLQLSPFIAERSYKRWEFGVRGAFIWSRLAVFHTKNEATTVEKTDRFILSFGQMTRYYFEFPKQKMRAFLLLDTQLIGGIGDDEINGVGGIMLFGIGAMYQINAHLAVEAMITTPLFSVNVQEIRGLQRGMQFWLGFRHCFQKKSRHE